MFCSWAWLVHASTAVPVRCMHAFEDVTGRSPACSLGAPQKCGNFIHELFRSWPPTVQAAPAPSRVSINCLAQEHTAFYRCWHRRLKAGS